MKPKRIRKERWLQIEKLYHAALEQEASLRGAFLAEACSGDEALLHEVESLLRSLDRADKFMETPALEASAQLHAESTVGPMIGRKLERYELLCLLGAGAMGEVYRARDSRLNRQVAIKVLPEHLVDDAEALARFEREAKAVAALSHPNILAIHDFGTQEGVCFAVMELLEGETLRARLARSALPWRQAVEIAAAIADGLEAAHAKGIVHRDVKPENLFLTKKGQVKILDFGIARIIRPSCVADGNIDSTVLILTKPGILMGTIGYMSPEQVCGQQVDHRSDIFSLGAVLYEMCCGRRAFQGNSPAETLNAVLKEDPPTPSQINGDISPAVDRVVMHCLEKNAEQRFQSAGDVAFALDGVSGLSGSTSTATRAARGSTLNRERLAWVATGLLLLAFLATLASFYFHRTPAEMKAIRFAITMPEKAFFADFVSVSPDGRRVVLRAANAEGRILYFVRELGSPDVRPLLGTEEGEAFFWSPDSRFLAFSVHDKLKRLDFSGEPPRTVCEGKGFGTWSRDGVILLSTGRAIFRVPALGGQLQPVRAPDRSRGEKALVSPFFLPDGRHFLYHVVNEQPGGDGAYVGSLDSVDSKRLVSTDMAAAYAPPGYLLFVRERTLLAQPFDVSRLELSGEPVEVAREVTPGNAYSYAPFSVSNNGVLVYQSRSPIQTQLTWLDRTGKELERVSSAGAISEPVLSPDEKWVAFPRRDTFKRDIWLLELTRGSTSRLTFGDDDNTEPVWSPDGRSIVFDKRPRPGPVNLYEKAASGVGGERLLLKSENSKYPSHWSRDGRYISYVNIDPVTKWDVWVLPTFGDRKPTPYLQSQFNEMGGVFSPDGKWIAYSSDESGKLEVYVQSFPATGVKLPVSNGGGEACWSRDGKELFYIALDQKMMSVELKATSGKVTASAPRPLKPT